MPLDFEKLAKGDGRAHQSSSSILPVAAAIAWRLAVKPTFRALLESPTSRAGADPVLSRRMSELEEEVRGLKDKLAALPEGNPSRLAADIPWRTKEKV